MEVDLKSRLKHWNRSSHIPCYWKCIFPTNPHVCRLVGWSVGWFYCLLVDRSVLFSDKAGKLHFHANTKTYSFIEMSYCELGIGCFISCVLVWNAPKEAGNCFQVLELLLVAFGAHFILYFTVCFKTIVFPISTTSRKVTIFLGTLNYDYNKD